MLGAKLVAYFALLFFKIQYCEIAFLKINTLYNKNIYKLKP